MRTWIASLLLVPIFSSADPLASFHCPQASLNVQGIKCCTNAVTEAKCKSIIKEELPEEFLKSVTRVQELFEKEEAALLAAKSTQRFMGPNCHWAAHALIQNRRKNPAIAEVPVLLNSDEWEKILKENYRSIEKKELAPGDLVVFVGLYETWAMDNDENGRPKKIKYTYEAPWHSAVWMGGEILFQKESNASGIFTFNSTTETQVAVEAEMATNFKLGVMRQSLKEIRYYRAN